MFKIVVLFLVVFLNLYGECECEETKSERALGVILSYGEGMGVSYRMNFEESYLQNVAFVLLDKSEKNENNFANYALSYGYYLFSSKNNFYHFKNVFSVVVNYEEETITDDEGSYKDIYKYGMLSGGFGFEIGKRERGSMMYGVDALYLFKYESGTYKLTPGIGVYAHYNF